MVINFIGNYQSNYVGEVADETHLTRNLEAHGAKVQRVPRDIWKAVVDGQFDSSWKGRLPVRSDINIICKWHHFDKVEYVEKLREISGAPVLYWVWDYMYDEAYSDFVGFHKTIAEASDLLLTNEGGLLPAYEASLINAYYFPYDVADETIKHFPQTGERDVAFFGTCLNQGVRIKYLKEINKKIPITVFSWNWKDWQKMGFDAKPAVYGDEFNQEVANSKICLQFSVNDTCWGYWSNRVGKTLLARGFLLAHYAPGMELFLKDGVEYFYSPDEAVSKIHYFLKNDKERDKIRKRGAVIGLNHFTSFQRTKELLIFMNNYLDEKLSPYSSIDLDVN